MLAGPRGPAPSRPGPQMVSWHSSRAAWAHVRGRDDTTLPPETGCCWQEEDCSDSSTPLLRRSSPQGSAGLSELTPC